jgi:predicted amidophosphoribosyltransferase
VVPVPPKPSQSRNRFAAVFEAADSRLSGDVEFELNGLKCVREVEGYKAMGPLDRARSIRRAFRSCYNWNGNGILLIDDVLTSGETVAECARILLANKASEVRIITFGKDQQTFVRKECPECGRSLRVRTNSYTGEKFWGCSGYPEHCQHSENM